MDKSLPGVVDLAALSAHFHRCDRIKADSNAESQLVREGAC